MFRLIIFSCLFLAVFAALGSRRKPSYGKIVGGHDTNITEVPYQVSVQYQGRHCCGGSIIGAKYILTAAHCVARKHLIYLSIRAGSSYHKKGGQEIDVAKVIIHSNFSMNVGNCDAAILVLEKFLRASDGVQIATLSNVEPRPGNMVLISGWGSSIDSAYFSPLLQSVSVPVVSKRYCKKRYKNDIEVTDQMFCAGFYAGGKDSCKGDSGGPAMVNGKLAGIVSWGDGCARKMSPGVYTNVASILDWIMAQIQQ